ncbi:MAG: proline dehydrogenase family protein [Gaiellaceae bacterium]
MLSEAVHAFSRRVILAASESEAIRGFVRRHGMRFGARRFVAGETFEEAVPVLRQLNERGLLTNTTLLGEGVREPGETKAVVEEYECMLDAIARAGLRTNLAVKPTHLGLELDSELTCENLVRLTGHAARHDNFVRMDMEESRYVDPTLAVYRRLRERGTANIGIVLQAYLYRSVGDLESVLDIAPNVRVCKGAYLEPPEIAYPDKEDVDAAYVRLLELALRRAGFVGIATHDERMIEHAIAFVARERIPRERFQFQMLYGVRPQLQLSLVRRGYPVLVATPYGPDWYRYLMRRLAERPANIGFLLRNLVRG